MLTFVDDATWFTTKVAEDVQQVLHDCFVDTVWPQCPRHRHHPPSAARRSLDVREGRRGGGPPWRAVPPGGAPGPPAVALAADLAHVGFELVVLVGHGVQEQAFQQVGAAVGFIHLIDAGG